MDLDADGVVSLFEFHTAVEGSVPYVRGRARVRVRQTLRRG